MKASLFPDPANGLNDMFEPFFSTADQIIIGKRQQIKLVLCCLLSRGHLLIEDLPGMGKTTLAHLIARLFDLKFSRIQFTSDMLPADITGFNIFDQQQQNFSFQKGPIFSQLVLADEINRTSAKTQSALLEAMEERQVSIDGKSYPLPQPFFVVATQNPQSQAGTFPLPESQLDRFLMRIHLGYPDEKTERKILTAKDKRDALQQLEPCFDVQQLQQMQKQVENIHVSDPVLDYILAILKHSRNHLLFQMGLSPRAGLALIHASKAWAFIHQREMVLPDDINAVLPAVVLHRLVQSETPRSDQEVIQDFYRLCNN